MIDHGEGHVVYSNKFYYLCDLDRIQDFIGIVGKHIQDVVDDSIDAIHERTKGLEGNLIALKSGGEEILQLKESMERGETIKVETLDSILKKILLAEREVARKRNNLIRIQGTLTKEIAETEGALSYIKGYEPKDSFELLRGICMSLGTVEYRIQNGLDRGREVCENIEKVVRTIDEMEVDEFLVGVAEEEKIIKDYIKAKAAAKAAAEAAALAAVLAAAETAAKAAAEAKAIAEAAAKAAAEAKVAAVAKAKAAAKAIQASRRSAEGESPSSASSWLAILLARIGMAWLANIFYREDSSLLGQSGSSGVEERKTIVPREERASTAIPKRSVLGDARPLGAAVSISSRASSAILSAVSCDDKHIGNHRGRS